MHSLFTRIWYHSGTRAPVSRIHPPAAGLSRVTGGASAPGNLGFS
jgi:hypothetical protein